MRSCASRERHGAWTCLKQLKLLAADLGVMASRTSGAAGDGQRRAGEMRPGSLCSHLAGWTVPRPGSEVEFLAPRSAQSCKS